MKPFVKLIVIALPFLTLILGWQLGVNASKLQVENAIDALEEEFGGTSSLGTITDPETEVDLKLFWTVWRKLLQEYNEPEMLDAKEMLYGAVSGMVRASADPYTQFMTPKQNTEFTDTLQGNLEGIGAELTFKDSLLTVVAPIKGSPAAKAGLLPNDIIIEVDGEPTDGQSLDTLVRKIRGPEGTNVNLTIVRDGAADLITLTITRAAITVPSTEHELKKIDGKNIGYVSLNQFGERSVQEVSAALDSFKSVTLDGLVLDMRFNGGGYLDKSEDIVSLFLQEGKVLSIERRGKESETHFVNGRAVYPDVPMVILLNEGSASASEIVAAALHDQDRAVIMGKPSFGKGSIQEVYAMPGGSSLRLTVAKWFTPDGKNVNEVGLMPDYEVDRTPEQYAAEEDPQLDAALQYLANDIKPVKSGTGTAVNEKVEKKK